MAYRSRYNQARAAQRHYALHRDEMITRAKAASKQHIAQARRIVRAAKDRPCADCDVQYPYYVMQFDHLPGEVKTFDIGAFGSRWVSITALRREIAKCEVVCANCHAERTHQRRLEEATSDSGEVADPEDDDLTLF